MEEKQKQEVESFATDMLGANQSVSVFTRDLREKMNVDVGDLTSSLGEYNQLAAEEKKFDFSRDFKVDDFDFWILIRKT